MLFCLGAGADITVKEADELVDEEGLGAGEVGGGVEHDGLRGEGSVFLVGIFRVNVDVGRDRLGVDEAVGAVVDDAQDGGFGVGCGGVVGRE